MLYAVAAFIGNCWCMKLSLPIILPSCSILFQLTAHCIIILLPMHILLLQCATQLQFNQGTTAHPQKAIFILFVALRHKINVKVTLITKTAVH